MLSIKKIPAPANTLLAKYSSITGAYTDCYMAEIPQNVVFSEYIFAFYTTPLFKLERAILKYTVSKPASDLDTKNLAKGLADKFAAWTVESRSANEILLCDFVSRTRSWLMTKSDGINTQVYFGSAVVPKARDVSLDFGFRALLGFHQIYSVLLLYSAKLRLHHQAKSQPLAKT